MTIAVGQTGTYTRLPCNGVAVTFNFPNKIFAAGDLVVNLIDTLGTLYPFVAQANVGLGLSYTVNNVDNDTGSSITMSSAPTNGWSIDMRTLVPEIQTTSIKNQGQFLPELHEEFFDRATRMLQDLYRLNYQFGVHGPDIETTVWPALPIASGRKNMILGFDANGLPSLSVVPSTALVAGQYRFVGTDSGAANAYIVTVTGNLGVTLTVGQLVSFTALNGNTGASTANIGATGAQPIVGITGLALTGGDILTSGPTWVQWTGAAWQIVGTGTSPDKVRTPGEITLGVVPSNFFWLSGDVHRYGAVGDGVADDWNAIQTAANLVGVSNRGGVVGIISFHVSVAYKTTKTIIVNHNTIFSGQGSFSTIIDYEGTGYAFATLSPINSSTSIYLGLRGLYLSCGAGAQGAYLDTGGGFIDADDVQFGGNVANAVVLNQTEVATFTRCKFGNSQAGNRACLWIVNGADITPALTFNAVIPIGATAGVLTAAWGGVTGQYPISFAETVGGASEVRLAVLTNGSTAVTWTTGVVVQCNAATITPAVGFTNRLTFDRNNFNPSGTYSVLDDGGVSHTYSNNNFGGGTVGCRFAGVGGLVFSGNECEAATTSQIQMAETALSGSFVGACEGFKILTNAFYGNRAAPYNIDFTTACNGSVESNTFGGYTSWAINTPATGLPGVSFKNNSKAVTGNGLTTGPFFNPAVLATAGYRTFFPEQVPVTSVPIALAANGVQTVAPADMWNIHVGSRLQVQNPDGTLREIIVVTGLPTAASFTASYVNAHNVANWIIRGCTPGDQEEGTWVPTLAGGTTAGVNTYGATTTGRWQRRGNLVTVSWSIDITAIGIAGNAMVGFLQVGGLPFSFAGPTNYSGAAPVSLFSGFTFAGAYTQLGGLIQLGATSVSLRKSGSAVATVQVPVSDIAGATCSVYGTATYQTTDA